MGIAGCDLKNGKRPFDNKYAAVREIATLHKALYGTSGLVYWNGSFWSHNDASRAAISEMDTNGNILRRLKIQNIQKGNSEDLTQDDHFIYLGDFGNNSTGARTDLRIYRIPKEEFLANKKVINADIIHFSYAAQTDFSEKPIDHTNFDCEAMICVGDSLYLFSKQWLTPGTTVYAMPKQPGNYVLQPMDFHPGNGLITGAATIPGRKLVVLCGYNTDLLTYLSPFILILQDYPGNHFFAGSRKRLQLPLPYHQVEAIALTPEGRCFITNEFIREYRYIKIRPKLYEVNIKPFLHSF